MNIDIKELEEKTLLEIKKDNIIYMVMPNMKLYKILVNEKNIVKNSFNILDDDYEEIIYLIENLGLDVPLSLDELDNYNIICNYNNLQNKIYSLEGDEDMPSIFDYIYDLLSDLELKRGKKHE